MAMIAEVTSINGRESETNFPANECPKLVLRGDVAIALQDIATSYGHKEWSSMVLVVTSGQDQ